ncbi:MAG: hypothetical protein V3U84_05365 [Thiotrichaceae bacterium]
MSRAERGFYYLGRYCYAHRLKNGIYSLYQGAWSDRGEDSTSGLEVVRDDNGNALRFANWNAVNEYFKGRY